LVGARFFFLGFFPQRASAPENWDQKPKIPKPKRAGPEKKVGAPEFFGPPGGKRK